MCVMKHQILRGHVTREHNFVVILTNYMVDLTIFLNLIISWEICTSNIRYLYVTKNTYIYICSSNADFEHHIPEILVCNHELVAPMLMVLPAPTLQASMSGKRWSTIKLSILTTAEEIKAQGLEVNPYCLSCFVNDNHIKPTIHAHKNPWTTETQCWTHL